MSDEQQVPGTRHDFPALWQASVTAPARATPDDFARRMRTVVMSAANHSTQLYVAAFFNVAILLLLAVLARKNGGGLGAIAGLGGWTYLVLIARHQRRKIADMAASGDLPSLVIYRAMLVRQRDSVSPRQRITRALAILAGPLTFMGGVVATAHGDSGAVIVALIVAACFIALALLGIRMGARQYESYQRQIDELP